MVLPAASSACKLLIYVLAGFPIYYSQRPRGSCNTCCLLNERDDIKFFLYTRANPTKAYRLFVDDDARLFNSNFRFEKPLALFMHGFLETPLIPDFNGQSVKNGFLYAGNYNVILVDWSPLVTAPWYVSSVKNVPVAARYVARFVRYLVERGFPVHHIHLVGFSLGAHAVGFVGRNLQTSGIMLPRITGLDPAYPLYSGDKDPRLGPDVANFVDVIHTDGGFAGHPEPLGHVDFYPNGGHGVQPGCPTQYGNNTDKLGGLIFLIGICSHQRAWMYFAESLKHPYAFPATSCEPTTQSPSCVKVNGVAYMGIAADRRLRGKFLLETNRSPPFGRNTVAGTYNAGVAIITETQIIPSAPWTPRVEEMEGMLSSPQLPRYFFNAVRGVTVI